MDEALGRKKMTEILGPSAKEIIKEFESISPDFSKYLLGFAYGDLYGRAILSDKSKELAAVACLIGQGKNGGALKSHLIGMRNVGWSKDEILEVILFLVCYIGFPSCIDALRLVKEIFTKKS